MDEPRPPGTLTSSSEDHGDDPLAVVLGAFIPGERDVIFRFFVIFSRFECALKQAGFIVKGKADAQPDWDRYASEFANFAGDNGRLSVIGKDLIDRPPRRQIAVSADVGNERTVDWKDTPRSPGETDAAYVLRLVRVVRNNLFHGGKYPLARRPAEDSAHQLHRLTVGIGVLQHCLASGPAEVVQMFRDLG